MNERRIEQYDFTVQYNKTFLSGHLKGITVPVKYGTCAPFRWEEGHLLTEYQTRDTAKITDFKCFRNF